MPRKGPERAIKRLEGYRFYVTYPKKYKWIVRTDPGPHKASRSIPLLVLLRDILHLVETGAEGRKVIKAKEIIINNRPVKNPGFPVGIFDIIKIPKINKMYIMLPVRKYKLRPFETDQEIYIGRIDRKYTTKGGRILLGLHNGYVFILPYEEGNKFKRLDGVIYEGKEIKERIPFAEGSYGIVVDGTRCGIHGVITKIIPGTMTQRSHTILKTKDGEITVLTDYVFPIGVGKPVVKLYE